MHGTTRTGRIVSVGLAALMLAAAASGCARSSDAGSDEMLRGTGDVAQSAVEAAPADVTGGVAPLAAEDTAKTDRLIVRTRTVRLEVKSTAEAVDRLRELATTHAAVITDLQVATDSEEWLYRYDASGYATGDGAALRGWMTVRVPAEALDAFVASATALGSVKYQSEGSEDVTQQHVDLSARLENLRAEEVRLRSFFDAARNVQEMLAVETELNRIRQEIESLDAQVTYLERQAAMATVTIELTEKRPVVRPDGDDWGFTDAVTSGFRGAADVVTFGIALIIATAPLWMLGLAAFFVIRAVLRARRARRARADGESPQPSREA